MNSLDDAWWSKLLTEIESSRVYKQTAIDALRHGGPIVPPRARVFLAEYLTGRARFATGPKPSAINQWERQLDSDLWQAARYAARVRRIRVLRYKDSKMVASDKALELAVNKFRIGETKLAEEIRRSSWSNFFPQS